MKSLLAFLLFACFSSYGQDNKIAGVPLKDGQPYYDTVINISGNATALLFKAKTGIQAIDPKAFITEEQSNGLASSRIMTYSAIRGESIMVMPYSVNIQTEVKDNEVRITLKSFQSGLIDKYINQAKKGKKSALYNLRNFDKQNRLLLSTIIKELQ